LVSFSLLSSSACVTELFTTSDVDEAFAVIALLTRFTELVCFGRFPSRGVAGLTFLCPAVYKNNTFKKQYSYV